MAAADFRAQRSTGPVDPDLDPTPRVDELPGGLIHAEMLAEAGLVGGRHWLNATPDERDLIATNAAVSRRRAEAEARVRGYPTMAAYIAATEDLEPLPMPKRRTNGHAPTTDQVNHAVINFGSGTLAETLDQLVAHTRKFVWFARPCQAIAVALWVAHTHAIDAVDQSPILSITSPVKQSGKSRLLDVLETVVPRPWRIERPSEAVLYRKIARDNPTVLMDEADTIFLDRRGEHEGIRAVFNAGNRRGTVVSRVMPKGKTFDLVDFAIFGPKAIAGIGRFPETVVDRSIVIAMTRRSPGERIERLRSRQAETLGAPIRDALAALVAGVADLRVEEGDDAAFPPELDDRGQDNWESLFAIAALAGGVWPALARQAAIELQADRRTADDNALVALCIDLHNYYGERPEETFTTTTTLLDWLHGVDTSPWSEWGRTGKPLTARGLAKLLAPLGIAPAKVREGGETLRGYTRVSFADAWTRFLPSIPALSATPGTPATPDLWAEATRIFGDDLVGSA